MHPRSIHCVLLCAVSGAALTAQRVAVLQDLDARVRATALVEVARVAIDAAQGRAVWHGGAADTSTWSSDPAVGVALSPDGRHLGVLFRTEADGTRAVAFAIDGGEATDLGAADGLSAGGRGAEFLIRRKDSYRSVDVDTGAERGEPWLRGLDRVELAPGGGGACVDARGGRPVAGPTWRNRDGAADVPIAIGHRLHRAAWDLDGGALAVAVLRLPAGGPAVPRGAVLVLRDPSGPEHVDTLDPDAAPSDVAFAANGRLLYVVSHRELAALDAETFEVRGRAAAELERFVVLDPVLGMAFDAQRAELWDLRRLERLKAVPLDLPAAPTDDAGARRLRALGATAQAAILDVAVRAPGGTTALATRAGVVLLALRR